MVLKFLMDPSERHGFGTLVLDSSLTLLDGAPLIGAAGKRSQGFEVASAVGTEGWEIGTQVEFIDLDSIGL